MRVALGAALVALWSGGVGWAEEACHPPEIGQVVLPGEPCYDIEVSFAGETGAYPHGALGDEREFTRLVAKEGLTTIRYSAPVPRVFEDLAPRVADLDGEPGPEIVVVESDDLKGALLAVYKPEFTGARPKMQWLGGTLPIGTRFRWLAPVGIADFTGDGRNDIAYVEMPHLAKELKIVTLEGGRLVEVASSPGFSNHQFGEAFITGGVRDCGSGPETITADGAWLNVVAARLEGEEIVSEVLGPVTGPESFAAALACQPLS